LIKRFIRRVLRIGPRHEPEVYPAAEHGIRRDSISHGARKVCEVLASHGHNAYVVGGAVRDLKLAVQPKDDDVATDAYPEDVHKHMRRSRLIGRRFKLVHAVFQNEVVEVSTFRAAAPGEVDEETGRVLRDNVHGTREQDAARRDFTMNALYYDPATETVLDWHHGVPDLRKRRVRIIGDPLVRFREDPIRMLRAVRLAAKLDFQIEPKTRAPIREMAKLIDNVPPARVFDEMLKLLLSGHAANGVKRLRTEGLHHGVLPLLDVILEQPLGEKFVSLALAQTDLRITRSPVRRRFSSRRSFGTRCSQPGKKRNTASSPSPRSFRRWIPCSTSRPTSSPFRAHRDDEGDLVAAAAIRPALGQAAVHGPRAPALPRGVRLPRAPRRERRGPGRARRLVAPLHRGPTGGGRDLLLPPRPAGSAGAAAGGGRRTPDAGPPPVLAD
jgi:hypothetical protein